jgi:hypothetical protein
MVNLGHISASSPESIASDFLTLPSVEVIHLVSFSLHDPETNRLRFDSIFPLHWS